MDQEERLTKFGTSVRWPPPRRSLEERNALVEKYYYLPRYVWKRMQYRADVKRLGPDDGESAGWEGLIRAAHDFDESRGLQFTTYAYRWVLQSLLRAAKNNYVIRVPLNYGSRADMAKEGGKERERIRKKVRKLVLQTDLHEDDRETYLKYASQTEERTETFSSLSEQTHRVFRYLNPQYRLILRLVFSEEMNFAEIGSVLGYSRESVRQKYHAAIQYVRRVVNIREGVTT